MKKSMKDISKTSIVYNNDIMQRSAGIVRRCKKEKIKFSYNSTSKLAMTVLLNICIMQFLELHESELLIIFQVNLLLMW